VIRLCDRVPPSLPGIEKMANDQWEMAGLVARTMVLLHRESGQKSSCSSSWGSYLYR
jgi:hypothetical protein